MDNAINLEGARFRWTSGTSKLKGTFEDMNKIFSPKNEESLPDFSCKHETVSITSNCCDAYVLLGERCSKCKEHCSEVKTCLKCDKIINE